MTVYYHVSKKYLGDTAILKPKVPKTSVVSIEGNIPRVCFSKELFYCIRSIIGTQNPDIADLSEFNNIVNYGYDDNEEERRTFILNPFIYKTHEKLYIPPQCSDFKANKEHWAITDIEVKLLGRLCLLSLINGSFQLTNNRVTLTKAIFHKVKQDPLLKPRSKKIVRI